MIKKSITLILFCCFIVLQASAQSSEKKETPPPLFTIAKKPVPSDEFIYLYRKNHTDKQGDFTQVKVEEYLDLFVNFKIQYLTGAIILFILCLAFRLAGKPLYICLIPALR